MQDTELRIKVLCGFAALDFKKQKPRSSYNPLHP